MEKLINEMARLLKDMGINEEDEESLFCIASVLTDLELLDGGNQ